MLKVHLHYDENHSQLVRPSLEQFTPQCKDCFCEQFHCHCHCDTMAIIAIISLSQCVSKNKKYFEFKIFLAQSNFHHTPLQQAVPLSLIKCKAAFTFATFPDKNACHYEQRLLALASFHKHIFYLQPRNYLTCYGTFH